MVIKTIYLLFLLTITFLQMKLPYIIWQQKS